MEEASKKENFPKKYYFIFLDIDVAAKFFLFKFQDLIVYFD